ncbi:threonine-phosphate decarboxylase [Acetobacter pomorum]|uniref:threonine-phosphate decarboxylase n=1 Tax=Acetobacter pomorum TaxID=65959 RepID=A0A2G4R7X4_9PROT|nr:threonine-phosphate decarboxylase CobD [Acetobacter pomorum]PHY92607.1 threonine-phosphate decarboxylase [Acetobacter pomorum]GBR47212.1 L-threonine-O-3-phosphate decarboxylase [Acetobacter pomorum DSM 11825]
MADAGVREKWQEGKGYKPQQTVAGFVSSAKTQAEPCHIPAHGGQVQKIMQMFAEAPQPFIDLSTGISPIAYPAKLPDLSVLHKLPEEAEEVALQHAAAMAYGVSDPNMVVAGGGSQSLIALLPRVIKAERAVILGPTYSGHLQAWKQNDIPVSEVSHFAQLHILAQQKNTVCIVCNPNNPDGRLIQARHLLDLANTCHAAGSWLVVDEAFADIIGQSIASALPHPALLVLRSFGKTYGLPGIRLGFLLAQERVAAHVRALLGSWPVNAIALAVGCQALQDKAWLRQASVKLFAARSRLKKLLTEARLNHKGQAVLFELVECEQAVDLWRHLCQQGIVTRIFPYNSHWLRMGLPSCEQDWLRLEAALQAWCRL